MALFEFTGTRLEATALGEPADAAQRRTVLGAVRGQLVDVLRRPVFPVVWQREGESDVLTALDAACQVMCVELLEHLDAGALVSAMARTAAAAQSGWADLASRYPGGSAAFRQDWDEFRETVPISAGPSPRLTLIAMGVNDDVRASLAMLVCSGVEVQEAQVRTASDGRVLVGLEPVRHDVLGGSGAVLVARASRVALEGPKAGDGDDDGAGAATTVPVPSARRGGRPSRAGRRGRATAPPTGHVAVTGPAEATGRVETARARPAGARAGRSRPARARAAGPAVVEPETVEAVETETGHNDVTVPTVRLVDAVDSAESAESVSTDTAGIDRNHRAAGPVLGAQPTVPSGGRSAAALASVASRIDTPATLVWQRVRRGIHHEAVLNAEGIITLSNGMRFRDPSAAANAAQHTQDIDGWRVWRIGAQGPALRDFIEG